MKFLKRLLKKQNNRGFTLVEVIISSVLLGILVIGVLGFATPIMNMIHTEQQSARATALAETIDSYISGTLRNARMVQVIQNTNYDRMHQPNVVEDTPLGLQEIYDFMGAGNNKERYEVRCLGICWVADQSSPYYDSSMSSAVPRKIMLVNLKVSQNFAAGATMSGALMPLPVDLRPDVDGNLKDGANKVFDDSMYFGLYPVIKFETFNKKDAAGNEIDPPQKANGYKVTAEIYSDSDCYNTTSQATRDKSHLAFTGVTYFELANMKSTDVKDINALAELQSAIDANKASQQYVDTNGASYYYPDTYIYYVVSKDYNL